MARARTSSGWLILVGTCGSICTPMAMAARRRGAKRAAFGAGKIGLKIGLFREGSGERGRNFRTCGVLYASLSGLSRKKYRYEYFFFCPSPWRAEPSHLGADPAPSDVMAGLDPLLSG